MELDPDGFQSLLDETIARSLPPEQENTVQAALREVDRRLVAEWLGRYRAQWENYDALWKKFQKPMAPELLEVSFGRAGERKPSTDQPLEFGRDGQTVRIAGRIDRIDTGVVDGQTVFNVLDYKTGGAIRLSADSIRAGTTLQLPLYGLATTELFLLDRDAIPWQAGYWYVRDQGFKSKQSLKMYRDDDGRIELEREWEAIRAVLGDTIVALVRAIRKGRFPVCNADDQCTGHCPYNTVCRVNQVRSLEKTCQPTADP
jgi:ATP-dependent helicase/DNAse subunit B